MKRLTLGEFLRKISGKMQKEQGAKKQVKIILPEGVHRELTQEARTQGLSLATYLRTLIFRSRLRDGEKNARMVAQGGQVKNLSRMPDLF